MAITHLFTNTSAKKSRRAGRGISAGLGKTAGRGTKGQKARSGSGRKIRPWFEGGQTPLFRRLAKKRGTNMPKSGAVKAFTLTTQLINRFYQDGEVVSPVTIVNKGIARAKALKGGVKVVGGVALTKKVTFESVAVSQSIQPKAKSLQ